MMREIRMVLIFLACVACGPLLRADRPVSPLYRPLVPHRLLALLHAPEVHEELEFSANQVVALEKLFDETDGPWFRARIKPQAEQLKVLDQLEQSLQRWLVDNTSPSQRERLYQLELQAQGSRIVLRDDVAKAINLTASQQQAFGENAQQVARAEAAVAKAMSQGKPLETLQQAVADATQMESKSLQGTLSPDQQQRLGRLLGEKFDTAKLTRIYPMAPELVPVEHWINSPPLTLGELRGQVVLVHFYAFQCHNCHANHGIYRRWHNELRDKGVVVIGIQTPETPKERDPAAVRADAVSRGLDFPILVDLKSENWKAWGNTMWPTVYVVDKNGYIRHWWQGELNWQGATGDQTIERVVEVALQESKNTQESAGLK